MNLVKIIFFVAVWCVFSSFAVGGQKGYVGSDVCAGCHKDIAKTQSETNMARTWQSFDTAQLPAAYSESHAEGPQPDIRYQLKKIKDQPSFQVQMPGQSEMAFPVQSMIGGKRHAISFLFRVPELGGLSLSRAPLIEGRYIYSVLEHGLALELGFPEEKPSDLESSLGRVLTPNLEKRCFGCHVAPRTLGTRVETGVACENCHGPGQAHLVALAARSHSLPHDSNGAYDLGILNPGKLPVAERMQPCSQCHAGSGFVEDPMASQLLISDQVTALKNSECWRQSAGQITCTSCHNPHQDAAESVLITRSEKTCLGCHSATIKTHAALCPVNRTDGCVQCHLPKQIHGAFHLADHWIRVHPEQKAAGPNDNPAWRTNISPKHLYLREIVFDQSSKAISVSRQLSSGASFFDLARANSVDRTTGINGGYMGDIQADQFNPAWASTVLKLNYGETSDVVQADGKHIIFQRMSRNFREDAEAKVDNSVALRKEGKQQESIAELFAALKIYPHFLRALTYLGISYSQSGNPQVGAGVLSIATRLYPKDQGAHFNLGVAYGAMAAPDEIAEYKRTLEIDPDYVPAYLNWGGSLYAKGKYDEAISLYKQGLEINPLNAALHYSLSVALDRTNRKLEAETEMLLATKAGYSAR